MCGKFTCQADDHFLMPLISSFRFGKTEKYLDLMIVDWSQVRCWIVYIRLGKKKNRRSVCRVPLFPPLVKNNLQLCGIIVASLTPLPLLPLSIHMPSFFCPLHLFADGNGSMLPFSVRNGFLLGGSILRLCTKANSEIGKYFLLLLHIKWGITLLWAAHKKDACKTFNSHHPLKRIPFFNTGTIMQP